MRYNYEKATQWMLVHEGGYVDHPKDPGGATNRGVTQRVYDGWRRRHKMGTQSVLQILISEVQSIYRTQYWDKIMGDDLPPGLDYALYDFAVNSGPSRAVKFLQRILKVEVDGQMGAVTLGAIQFQARNGILIDELCTQRLKWMKTLKTFKTFGRGWTRRVMGEVEGAQPGVDTGVVDRARQLYLGKVAAGLPGPEKALPGKAEDKDQKIADKVAANPSAVLSAGAGAAPGLLSAMTMAPEGPVQWAMGAALLVIVLVGGAIAYKRFA